MTSPSVSMDFLKTLTGGDAARMKKYIDIFLQQAPGELEQMRRTLEAKDWPALRVVAHTLKPKMVYMGMPELEAVVRDIEESAAGQVNLESLPGLVARVEEELGKGMESLRRERENLS